MGAQAVRLSNVDIDNALKDRNFEVLFQPIFDLGNGALARVESFIRWRHPSLGILPPGAFISFFETQGRMSELTRYVLAEALSEYQDWRGPHAPGLSINLALSDLSDESFASHFTVLLRERGFPAELVTLECPMPPVDADIGATARQLQRLAETGARLAIEVRGRANDFLRNIRPFPFAEIKTGGAAILRFARTVRGPGLSAISELLELAAEQNAAITAVGVEDQASLSALRGLGFAAAQGNHLARVGSLSQFMPSHVNDVRALLGLEPLSAEDLAALFRTGGPQLASPPPQAAEAAAETAAPDKVSAAEAAGEGDDLVERLAARIARAGASKHEAGVAAPKIDPRTKAAAIARARRKSIIRERLAARNALQAQAEDHVDNPAPRDMQERLSREFESFAECAPAADEFELTDDPPKIEQSPAGHDAPAAGAAEAPREPTDPEEAAAPAEEPASLAAPPARPVAPRPAPEPAAMIKQAHIEITGATARFEPMIRVGGPEPLDEQHVLGDLHRETDDDGSGVVSAVPQPSPGEPAQAAAEDEIPAPMAGATWIEETVEARVDASPKRRKSFLARTIIPYSALRITHFWPRSLRRLMKRAGAPGAAE